MTRSIRHLIAGVALGVTIGGVSALGFAQVAIRPRPVEPQVFAAEDVGARMTARTGDTPVGQLVVKVDGEWKEVEFSYGMKLATQ
jgi:hypothetical protein